jgi:hypothetical protein
VAHYWHWKPLKEKDWPRRRVAGTEPLFVRGDRTMGGLQSKEEGGGSENT